ncbi:MAG: hypothetical protein KDC84_11305 [Crocinitomicaceae bacterium]|nr:hypothetical protein [Crocinitomicaceae bacterium]
MRPIYLLLKFTLMYSLNVYFRKIKLVNPPKKWRSRTVFVLNHPSAFLDPLLVSDQQNTIIHFMVRSDVFKPALKPLFWSVHMLPIYRSLDGEGALDKNEAVFNTCHNLLKKRRSLLLFGEGFTDDTFIRRLKPMKKGPVRIAFGAMEKYNWDFDLEIVSVGINYTDPNHFRSDVLISYSEPIKVNAYKERYAENPQAVMTEVTKKIESNLQAQITHYKNKDRKPLHEGIMRITRKGMNAEDFDPKLPMTARWKYSRDLANQINAKEETDAENMDQLQKEVSGYFSLLKKFRLKEKYIHEYRTKGKLSNSGNWLFLILLFPLALVGAVHNFIPYYFTKRFVEGSFRRKVFWGGVKMMVGKVLIGLFNIPYIFLFYHLVYPSYWLGVIYYFTVPAITGLIAYNWFNRLKILIEKNKIKKAKIDLGKFVKKEEELEEKIGQVLEI